MEGTVTIEEVVWKTRQAEKRQSTLSAIATPFVPRLGVRTTSATLPEDEGKVANDESKDTAEEVPEEDTIVRLDWAAPHQGRAEEKSECKGANNPVDEMAAAVVNQHAASKGCYDEQDDFGEFVDIELSAPASETMMANEDPDSGTSNSDVAVQDEKVELSAEPRPSYDDLMNFWAIDDSKAKLKSTRTCYWAIKTLFTNFTRST